MVMLTNYMKYNIMREEGRNEGMYKKDERKKRIKSNKGMNECLSEIEEHNNEMRMYIV